ncbi:hypothetical protein CC86DRAFT_74538 [Ophiobolus disseminans]|uniref:BTB domain-containing protein n=1 Tax=Ophiobolus disseminans TaxID=1469910 RepID=A0A6A6ZPF8_9PLEO|nr:hypothetical protein CC86DRAFT_74538 [Ophiobolus disseminans]
MSVIVKQGACPAAIVRSYKNGDFTDLTITCGPLTFNVHILVVCSSSDFFRKSVMFPGKESEKKCIDLPEDDPEMIRRLVSFLYLGDYDPSVEMDMSSFDSIKQHQSTTVATPTYHPRKGASGGSVFAPLQCACLSPTMNNIVQPMAKVNVDSKRYIAVVKDPNTMQVLNPLTIHASMYALGDKYHVEGLSQLAKTKFESCIQDHAHSEDFITAVQTVYSTTPDSNRRLRDVVVTAFRTEFKTDIKQIPGAEAKLDCIDELSFLLIKSWPTKVESPNLAQTNSGIAGGFSGFGCAPVGANSSTPAAQPAQPAPRTSLFGSQPAAPASTANLFGSRPVAPGSAPRAVPAGAFGHPQPTSTATGLFGGVRP